MYRTKVQLICIFASISFLTYAQNKGGSKSSTNSETSTNSAKKNNTKPSYYIDSDGVIIFTSGAKSEIAVDKPLNESVQTNSGTVTKVVDANTNTATEQTASELIKQATPASGAFKVDSDGVVEYTPVQSGAIIDTDTTRALVKPNFEASIIRKEPLQASTNVSSYTNDDTSGSAVPKSVAKNSDIQSHFKKKPRGPIFEKPKTSYKSLEEAAIETDKALAKISMSDNDSESVAARVSKGNRPSLSSISPTQAIKITPEDIAKYGNYPTYYVNGVEVPRKEFLKIGSNYLSRELRVPPNTVSNNPNGELWIRVATDDQ